MSKKHKLNIFLIKDEYSCPLHNVEENLLKEVDVREKNETVIEDDHILFYKPNIPRPISWASFFDNEGLSEQRAKSVSGLCFKEVEDNLFAISFGHGKHLMKDHIYIRDFGLKIVLNVIDENAIKKISSKNLSGIPKDLTTQSTQYGDINFFSVDKYSDLLKSATGKVGKNYQSDFFTKRTTLTGSSSLSVNNREKG